MTPIKVLGFATLAAALSACGSYEGATRNVPLEIGGLDGARSVVSRSYQVTSLNFAASDELSVSERNTYYPFADIVWRGDPVGDRKIQIGAMFQEAAARNRAVMAGSVPVVIDVELVRFHGVTERTRFSVGGNYNIVFDMTIRHAQTGLIVEPRRRVVGNLSAPGGEAAVLAEHRGQTEKVRVTDFLTLLMRDELTGEVVL